MKPKSNPFLRNLLTASLSFGLAHTAWAVGNVTWNSGATANWNVAGNWTAGTGGTAPPAAGDSLIFATTTGVTTLNNDITAGTSFGSITFNSGASAFTLNGNSIALGGNITNNATTNTEIIGLAVDLVSTNRTINVASGSRLELSGAWSRSGGNPASGSALTIANAAGTVAFTGSWSSTAISMAVSNGSTLEFNSASGGVTGRGISVSSGAISVVAGTHSFTQIASSLGSSTGANTGNYTQSGGSMTFSTLTTSNAAGTNSTVTISAGSLNATTFNISRGITGGNGTIINLSGTGLLNAGAFNFGDGGTENANSINTATIGTGAELRATTAFNWGNSGATVRNNTVEVNGGLFSTVATTASNAASNAVLNIGNGGTLQARNASGTFLSGLDTFSIKDGGAKIDTQANNITITNNILNFSGATTASLTKLGSGTLTLSGTGNTYGGGTTISVGTLQATNAGALPNYSSSSKVSVANNATLALNYGGASDWTSTNVDNLLSANGAGFASGSMLAFDTTNLSGSYAGNITVTNLGLTKLGTNTLTLSGSNSYGGGNNVNAGILKANAAGALGSTSGALAMGGGQLDMNGASHTVGAVTITVAATGVDTITNGTLSGSSYAASLTSGTATISATLAGSSSTFGMNGVGGTVKLTGPNTYGGTTTITAGTVQVGVDSVGSVGSITSSAIGTGGLTFNGGTLSSDSTTARTILNAVTFTGDAVLGNATNTGKLTFSAGIALGNAVRTLTLNSNAQFDGIISDTSSTGGITKAGAGILTLTNASNSYGGATTVNAGVLNVQNINALGTTAGSTTVASGAAIELQGGISYASEALSIDGGGVNGSGPGGSGAATNNGALRNVSGSNTWNGNITVGSAAVSRIGADSGSTLTIAGDINLTGSATGSQTTLQGDGTIIVNGKITGTGQLTSSSTGNSGVRTLTNNANDYSSKTNLNGGRLRIGANGALGASTVVFNGGTLSSDGSTARTIANALSITNNIVLGNSTDNGKLTFTNASSLTAGNARTWTVNSDAEFQMNLDHSAGVMTKEGVGNLILKGGGTLSRVDVNNGTLTISGGTYNSNNYFTVNTLASGAASYVQSGGTVNLNHATFGAYIGNVALSTSTFTVSGGAFNVNNSEGLIMRDIGTATMTVSGAGQLSSTGTGGLSFQKNGSTGTFNLGDGSTFSGGTSILDGGTSGVFTTSKVVRAAGTSANNIFNFNGGTLKASVGTTTFFGDNTNIAANVMAGGGIIDNNTFNITIGQNLLNGGGTDGGMVFKGSGITTLTGTSTYNGGTRIDSGTTLTLGNATDTLANGGAVNVNGGTLALGTNSDTVGAVALTSGSITGTGGTLTGTGSNYDVRSGSVSAILGGSIGLDKSTGGTVTLSGTNTYTGRTTVKNGTVSFSVGNATATANQQLGTNTALDLGVASISSGTLLYTGGAGTLAKNINALGNGSDTIQNSGTGLLTLTGTLTKNGTVLTLKGGANGIQVDGVIQGSNGSLHNSDLVIDGGTTTLTNAETYDGPTYIKNGGTLRMQGNSAALPAATDLILDSTGSGGSTFLIVNGGANQTVGSLAGASTSIVDLDGQHLTVGGGGNSNSTIYAGIIQGSNSSSELIKTGSGMLTLSNNNTYKGLTTVSGGTLQYGVNNAISSGGITLTGGTLDMVTYTDSVGAFTLTSGTLKMAANQTASPQLSSTGAVSFGATNTLDLTGMGTSAGLYKLVSGTSLGGTFGTVTGLDSAYTLKYGTVNANELDAQHKATISLALGSNAANVHVGSQTVNLSIGNTAPSGSADLSYTLGGVTGSGTRVAGAGSSAATGSYTAVAGPNSFNITASDAAATNSPQTVAFSQTGYRLATGSTPDLNLGKARVGGTLSGFATVTNSATNDGFSENLDATVGSNTGNVNSSSGSFSGLVPGANSSTAISIGLDTATSGSKSGTATVSYNSNGFGNSGLGTTPNGATTVNVTGAVYDYASSAFGGGSLVNNGGGSWTLDFGSVNQNASVSSSFNLYNLFVSSFQDALGGSFNYLGSSVFSGPNGAITQIAAGGSNLYNIGFDTTNTGTFGGTYTFNGLSQQSGLLDANLTGITLTVSGVVIVPEPDVATLIGGIGMLFLLRRRR